MVCRLIADYHGRESHHNWTYDHLVIWVFGHIWTFGQLQIWTFGYLEIEIWTFGIGGKRFDKLTKGEETQRQHFAESEIKISDHHIDAMVHCSALQEWVLDNQEVKSEENIARIAKAVQCHN